MRCEQCEKIPLVEIHTPQEYMLCIGSLARMLLAGEVEMTYQTCPLDKIMDNDNKAFPPVQVYKMRHYLWYALQHPHRRTDKDKRQGL